MRALGGWALTKRGRARYVLDRLRTQHEQSYMMGVDAAFRIVGERLASYDSSTPNDQEFRALAMTYARKIIDDVHDRTGL
jgi:hypothetical protein